MEAIKRLLRQFEFTFTEAINNFIRSGWMSGVVVTTMIASLTIFGGFWFLIKDFNFLADSIGSKLQIIAFLKKDANLDKVYDIVANFDGITKVDSISKEQGWKELSVDLQSKLDLENINNQNPLPDSLQITVKDVKMVDEIALKIKKIPEVEEIKYSKELAEYIEQFASLVRFVGSLVTIVLGLSSLAIIVNTIRLAVNSRKTEIEIMRLVGATNWFIRMPFLLEGIFFGICSAIFTSIILVMWRSFSTTQMKKLFPFFPLEEQPGLITEMIWYIAIISILIGFLGSALSVTRYLSFEKANSEEG